MRQVPFIVMVFSFALIGVLGFASRKVKPNPLMGYRNKYTLGNEHVWRVINDESGRDMGFLGCAGALLSLLGILFPSRTLLLATVGFVVVGVACLVAYYHRKSRRLFLEQVGGSEALTTAEPDGSPAAPFLWRQEAVPLGIIAATALLTALLYPGMPERVPIHYGFTGNPDRWADKTPLTSSILLLTQVFLYVVLTGCTRIGLKRARSFDPSTYAPRIRGLKTSIVALLGAMHLGTASGLFTRIEWLRPIWVPVMGIGFPILIVGWFLRGIVFGSGVRGTPGVK